MREAFHWVPGRDYRIIRGQDTHIRLLQTGQKIALKSCRHPDVLVSDTISHYTITEMGQIEKEAFDNIHARLRCNQAVRLQGCGEGTPEGLEHWWAEVANFPEGEDKDGNYRRIILPTRVNRHNPDGYLASLERRFAHDKQRLLSYTEGVFTPFTKGSAYWEFVQSRDVVLDVRPQATRTITMGWDFNVSPLAWTALQEQIIDHPAYRYNRYVALNESSGNSRGLLDACAEFIQKFPPAQFKDTRIEIDGDPNGWAGHASATRCPYEQIIDYLRTVYTNVVIVAERYAPGVQSRLELVNKLFTYRRFVIGAWCRNLIKSLSTSCLKKGTWDILKTRDENDWTHWSDGVGYPLVRLTRGMKFEDQIGKKVYGINV
jgi:hypothetical protein